MGSKNQNVNKLLQRDDKKKVTPSQNEVIQNSRKMISHICKTISYSPGYDPQKTLNAISSYINNEKYLSRLLYSQISAYIFSLSEEECSNFTSNVSALLSYTMETKNCDPQMQQMIIRIYDHSDLAIRQKNMLSTDDIAISQNSIREDMLQLKKETEVFGRDLHDFKQELDETRSSVESTQRDYITIFGVFSAIIITFVGGISFTSSVLESMTSVSMFRLIFIVCLLGLILFNSIYLLISVVLKVSRIRIKRKIEILGGKMSVPTFMNVAIFLIMFVDLIMYFIHAEQIRDLVDWLPWLNSID